MCHHTNYYICLFFQGNFRQQFQHLGEIRAVLDTKVMALTATCTPANHQTIMSKLSMDAAVLVRHTSNHPNIFLVVREMPGDFTKWQEMLDEDILILILKALGISFERKVIFCRSIKMGCTLYEYYEDGLSDCTYRDPQGSLILSNHVLAMYHLESASSIKTTICHYWILTELSGVCLQHSHLEWALIIQISAKLFTGVFHVS